MADVDDLRARLVADRVTTTHAQDTANKATPGPWATVRHAQVVNTAEGHRLADIYGVSGAQRQADMDLMAESRTLVPALVALVDARDAAIQAVLNLHVAIPDGQPRAGECSGCTDAGSIAFDWCCGEHSWPCPTVAAVVSALDGNGQNT